MGPGMAPNKNEITIETEFVQPIRKRSDLLNKKILFSRPVTEDEITKHLYYRSANNEIRIPFIAQDGNIIFKQSETSYTVTFRFTYNENYITCIEYTNGLQPGGSFIWGEIPEMPAGTNTTENDW